MGLSACATHVLVDKNDANVFALLGESLKGSLNCGRVCLAVDDEEVLLCIGAGRNVLSV